MCSIKDRDKSKNKGLISADRAKVALSGLQYLFHVKSSASDLSSPIFEYTCDRIEARSEFRNCWPEGYT